MMQSVRKSPAIEKARDMNFIRSIDKKIRFEARRWNAFRRLGRYHAKTRTIEETVDWAMHFGSRKEFTVNTIQQREEILALARAVDAIKPKTILEIGTALGGTLLIWSRIASDLVISCDIEDRSIQKSFYTSFPPPESSCKVSLLTGDSHTREFRALVEKQLNGRPVDFLFIDGDHTEKGVTADYLAYRDLVRPGGIIAFHDIVEKQPTPQNQVYHLWKKIRETAVVEEFVGNPDQCGYGIGIIHIP